MTYRCSVRDRLWVDYNQALEKYLHVIDLMAENALPHAEALQTESTLGVAVSQIRTKLRKHCGEHGCDSEQVKAVALKMSA
jgi:hypothetical protein